jgi:hypothetical protein
MMEKKYINNHFKKYLFLIIIVLCITNCSSQIVKKKKIREITVVNKEINYALDTIIQRNINSKSTIYIISNYRENSIKKMKISFMSEGVFKKYFRNKIKSIYGMCYYKNKLVLLFGEKRLEYFEENNFLYLPNSLYSNKKNKIEILPIFDPEVSVYIIEKDSLRLEKRGVFSVF